MNIVCEKCGRVLINNRWINDVVPIDKASYTTCPDCQAKAGRGDKSNAHGMVYQENLRGKGKNR